MGTGIAFLGSLQNLNTELNLSALASMSPAAVSITGGTIGGLSSLTTTTTTTGTLSATGAVSLSGAVTITGSLSLGTHSLAAANAMLTGGTIDNMAIGSTTKASGAFTALSASGNVSITGATSLTGLLTASGGLTTASATISGGTLDSTPIGATLASTARFTTLATSGAATLGSISTATASITTLTGTSATLSTLTVSGTSSLATVVVSGTATVPTPSASDNSQSAATTSWVQQYVSTLVQGLQIKPTATVATTSAIPANTYSSGTITASASGILTVDGHAVAVNDLVLVKNEATAANNGLYVCSTAGTASVAFVLTRHADMNGSNEFTGAFIPVGSTGTANANSLWLCNPVGAVTVGTTAIPFTQLNGATDLIAGAGIAISGNTISAQVAAITSGTINGATISASTGAFTTLSASSFTTSSATITGGSINATPIGAITPSTVAATTLAVSGTSAFTGIISSAAEVQASQMRIIGGNYGLVLRNDGSNFYLLATASGAQTGTWSALRPFSFSVGTGLVSMSNGVTIGGGLTVTSGTTAVGVLTASGATTLSSTLAVTGLATLASVAINAGAINATTIGATTASTGSFTTLASSGLATLASLSTASATITGGTIDATPIGATTPSTISATTVSTTALATLSSLITPSADINGGTVDGTIIGGAAAAAGTFTTLQTTTLNVYGSNTSTVPAYTGIGLAVQGNMSGGDGEVNFISTYYQSGQSAFRFYQKTSTTAASQIAQFGLTGAYLNYGLTVNLNTALASTLSVGGAATLSSTLSVTGATTLGTLGAGATTLSSTLSVTGATTLSSTLAVTGATTITSLSATSATLSSTLAVTGATTLSSTLAVTGAATMSSIVMGSTAGTAGTTNKIALFGTAYGFGISTSSLDYVSGGAHTFYTGATITGTLSSTGLSLPGTLAVTGAATLSNTLTVTGALTANGAATFNGTATFNGAVAIYNAATLPNTASAILNVFYAGAKDANADTLRLDMKRQATSTNDWTSAYLRLYRNVDGTPMGYIQFGSATVAGGQTVEIGLSNTTVLAVQSNSVTSFQPAYMSSTLAVTGASTFASTVGVTGSTTLSTVSTSGLATLASLTVTGASTHTGATTFASDPIVNGGALSPQLKALQTTTGGGTIAFTAAGAFSWSARFICMNAGNGALFSTNGYFDLNMPSSGSVVTGYNGATSYTMTSAGTIPIASWQTLYYILPIGSSNTTVNANFALVQYGSGTTIVPAHWVPIATRSGDTGLLSVIGGRYMLAAGDSLDTTTFRPGVNNPGNYTVAGNLNALSAIVGGGTTILTAGQLYYTGGSLAIGNAGSGNLLLSQSGATTAVQGNLTVAGNTTTTGITVSGAGFLATNTTGVALGMGINSALRDSTNGASTMFFDVSTGGSTNGGFSWRTTSGFTTVLSLDANYNFNIPVGSLVVQGNLVASGNQIYAANNGTFYINANGTGNVSIGGGGGGVNMGSRLDCSNGMTVYDSAARAYWAGVVTEVGSQMIDIGINQGQVGGNNTAAQGGMFRVDTRSGQSVFNWLASPSGSATQTAVATMDNTGNFSSIATISASSLTGRGTGAQFIAPGYMLYSDGTYMYVLLSGTNTPTGTPNSQRPFYINLTTGLVNMGQGLAVSTSLVYNNAVAADVLTGSTNVITGASLAASSTETTLTYAATIAWNMQSGYNANVTLTGNPTIGVPTNSVAGRTYVLRIIQDATGTRTVSWPTAFDWGAAGAPTLTTTASKADLIFLYCVTAGSSPVFYATCAKGF